MQAIPDPLARHAATIPDRVALRLGEHVVTFQELDRRVRDSPLATEATDLYLSASPTMETVITLLASFRAGRRAVLEDPNWSVEERQKRRTRLPPIETRAGTDVWPLSRELVVVFTSGTTGQGDAVPLTVEQVLYSTMGAAIRLGHHLDDVWLSPLPLYHVGGLSVILRSLLLGITAEILTTFDAADVARRLASGRPSLVSLVPTMLARVLAIPEPLAHPRLRAVVVGGAPLSEELFLRAKRRGLPVCRTYGSSETAAMVATDVPACASGLSPEQQYLSPIPATPFMSLSTVNGAIVAEGMQVQVGRWRSQDAGDADGHTVSVQGRRDRVIVSGGKKIAPEVTERALSNHPSIRAAVCMPWSDPDEWGELMIAWVEVSESHSGLNLDTILRDLPREQRPRAYVFGDLPRSALGKVTARSRHDLFRALHAKLGESNRPLTGRVFTTDSRRQAVAEALTGQSPEPLYLGDMA